MQTIALLLKAKITTQYLAGELNLTAATVSRALSDHPRISAGTKKLVNDLAEKLNYRRNRLASSLRSGKTFTIGVIIPSADINFFGAVVHGIESMANKNGYHILLYQSNESPEYEIKAIESFIGVKVDGILASIAKETKDFKHYIALKKSGLPLVLFDRTKDSLNIPAVVVDDYKGAYIATEHFIKQGYKRIAHISGQQHLKIFQERLKGYKAALKANGMQEDEALIYSGNVSIEAGKEAFPSIISWQPFNEAWGQFKTEEITKWTMQKDPTRIVNSASGGNFYPVGDVIDLHSYPDPAMPAPEIFGAKQALVCGEFGGLGLPLDGHTWQQKNWGYQSFGNSDSLYMRYTTLTDKLAELIQHGLSAAVYTQTTDVEGEVNGFMTYDRKVMKMPVDKLKAANDKLYTITQ